MGGDEMAVFEEGMSANQLLEKAAKRMMGKQQDAAKRALEFQNNILRGTAGALGSTQTQYTPAPSLASQITGMGIAGLGLYNALS